MAVNTVIECPDCRGRIVCEAQALRTGLELSCPVCGGKFPCGTREIRQALKGLTR